MKVIGIVPGRWDEHSPVVQLSHTEWMLLVHGTTYLEKRKSPTPGDEIDICKRFAALVAVESQLKEARKAAGMIRDVMTDIDIAIAATEGALGLNAEHD